MIPTKVSDWFVAIEGRDEGRRLVHLVMKEAFEDVRFYQTKESIDSFADSLRTFFFQNAPAYLVEDALLSSARWNFGVVAGDVSWIHKLLQTVPTMPTNRDVPIPELTKWLSTSLAQ